MPLRTGVGGKGRENERERENVCVNSDFMMPGLIMML
jgi:hypothetical protein